MAVKLTIGIRRLGHFPTRTGLKPHGTSIPTKEIKKRASGEPENKNGSASAPQRAKEKGGGLLRRPRLGECLLDDYQFLVMRSPNRRGSVVKTLVVRPVSSELRNAPVIAVVSNTFFT